ncbi:MAG: RNA polymerase-associated protein RapA [Kiritimatiellae bacterium]|nr:RNA polymerase-associated protein RapA [Kiritimatiellia bacterium]
MPGQRWISETEPELGLGTVLKIEHRRVSILFPGSGEIRQYALESAPIKRVQFQKGDTAKSHENVSFIIETIKEYDGLFIYSGENQELPENLLCDTISFNASEERLLQRYVDTSSMFDLRYETLQHQHRIRSSAVRGFVGGRMDLIPHQLYIGHEVTSRIAPRVLLADEVGLGKTIEACLIIHRLYRTGEAQRVLVLVPDALVHQWFVELLRRFNLNFAIFDETRCSAIEENNPDTNPFLDDQLVLCNLNFLVNDKTRTAQVLQGEWDLVVVDEAHHLQWSPENPSQAYTLVETLGRQSPGLLLLTATPEQLGEAGHFARLHILDADRHHALDVFLEEVDRYQEITGIISRLLAKKILTASDKKVLLTTFSKGSIRLKNRIEDLGNEGDKGRELLMRELLDQHGMGRVVFRNTRRAIDRFSKRIAHLKILSTQDDPDLKTQLNEEFLFDMGWGPKKDPYAFNKDPRIIWLAKTLRKLRGEKVLLICCAKEKVLAINEALRNQINANIALFHEDLPLIHRDRNAAWFSEKEGAQILICSEVGGEGRNFQFAHHLILFDLPLDPDQLEQRIGRLDRIGQRETIHIHVPYVRGTFQEILARWYHQGLQAFEHSVPAGQPIVDRFRTILRGMTQKKDRSEKSMNILVQESINFLKELTQKMEAGRNRLLELSSFKQKTAEGLIGKIQKFDCDTTLANYASKMFDHYGIYIEDLNETQILLMPSHLFTDAFPAFPAEGMTATYDRTTALEREDIGFLTWDHPLITGAMDLMIGSEQGNSAMAIWPDPSEHALLLEAVYVLECVASKALTLDRYMPPMPIRIIIDPAMKDCTETYTSEFLRSCLQDGQAYRLLDNEKITRSLLPPMIKASQDLANKQALRIKKQSSSTARRRLAEELERLETLKEVNDSVRTDEIEKARTRIEEVQAAIKSARLRLDALRFIWKGTVEGICST